MYKCSDFLFINLLYLVLYIHLFVVSIICSIVVVHLQDKIKCT